MEQIRSMPYHGDEGFGRSSQLLQIIDRALDQYGTTTKQVVYWNFQSKFGLTKKDIERYPEKFVQSLRVMFGDGSRIVEQAILHEVVESVNVKIIRSSDLTTALKQLRAYYQRGEGRES